ncbi:hypothetical protein HDU98_009674 [Podochytrium sp. JEL0797]|nr:hypothetical protein HDU98_009674 [Podochytrium sp. JEL0797]
MNPSAAFTVYFTDASCAGNASRIAYDTSAACVPSASVTTCQPSAGYPNWHILQGCTNNYTATGTTYFGPVMQVQYQRSSNQSAACANFPAGGQYPINQCVPTLTAATNTTGVFLSESVTLAGVFNSEVQLNSFPDAHCELVADVKLLGNEAAQSPLSSDCYNFQIVNHFGWFEETYGSCPLANGTFASPNSTSIQAGRSLNQPCVPSSPQDCSSKNSSTRSCYRNYTPRDFNTFARGVYWDQTPYVELKLQENSTLLQVAVAAPLDMCVRNPSGNGSMSASATRYFSDPPLAQLATYNSANCGMGFDKMQVFRDMGDDMSWPGTVCMLDSGHSGCLVNAYLLSPYSGGLPTNNASSKVEYTVIIVAVILFALFALVLRKCLKNSTNQSVAGQVEENELPAYTGSAPKYTV